MERDRQQWMEDHFSEALTPEEQEQFQKMMENDPSLKKEVEGIRSLDLQLKGVAYDQMVEEVSRWDKAHHNAGGQSKYYRYLAIAASIAAVFLFFNIFSGQNSEEKIFSSYYSPYENMITSRSNDTGEQLREAMEAYDREDFTQASVLLQQYLATNPDNKGAKLYLAISQMETGATGSATQNLSGIIGDSLFGQQAQWYLALFHLRAGDTREAEAVLKQIGSDEDHYRAGDAGKILQELH
jgi:hypothetical protein